MWYAMPRTSVLESAPQSRLRRHVPRNRFVTTVRRRRGGPRPAPIRARHARQRRYRNGRHHRCWHGGRRSGRRHRFQRSDILSIFVRSPVEFLGTSICTCGRGTVPVWALGFARRASRRTASCSASGSRPDRRFLNVFPGRTIRGRCTVVVSCVVLCRVERLPGGRGDDEHAVARITNFSGRRGDLFVELHFTIFRTDLVPRVANSA